MLERLLTKVKDRFRLVSVENVFNELSGRGYDVARPQRNFLIYFADLVVKTIKDPNETWLVISKGVHSSDVVGMAQNTMPGRRLIIATTEKNLSEEMKDFNAECGVQLIKIHNVGQIVDLFSIPEAA